MYFHGFNINFSSNMYSSVLDWFHNFNCTLLYLVLMYVVFCLLYLFYNKKFFLVMKDYQMGEMLFGIVPIFILIAQMVPSLSLLYFYNLMGLDSYMSVKVVGSQWYWSYDYTDFNSLEFNSYMKSNESLVLGDYRLLDVDNRCVIPLGVELRFCVTSTDVIHAWTVFNYFIKMDAVSGMLSIFYFEFPVVGVYFGQCSEICGANHSFMPVVVEVVPLGVFKYWTNLFSFVFY